MKIKINSWAVVAASGFLAMGAGAAGKTTIEIDLQKGKAISPDLVGIFYEDLSHAADGGLYAELVQNRDFEYSAADKPEWNALTTWELVERDGGRGSLDAESASPLNANTPNYAVLAIDSSSGQVGLRNEGFDGIPVKAGEHYDFSVFARRISGNLGPITVRIESKAGDLLGEAVLPKPNGSWKKYTASIDVKTTDDDARLIVLSSGRGKLALDFISLFPGKTFHNRPNGLRADLAQVIADLKPKFMRFPGGCLVHGDGIDNIYHWKDTIGPVEQRKGQPNIWRYHQTVGLGYFEYFQFCEDIGAKPVPVVAAGVCCQNSNFLVTRKYGVGQEGIPMDEMPAYVQDVLDLIEYANGPVDSEWGSKRAAAGHPEPFGLEYLGVGNEDHITPVFKERFEMIYNAVKAKHPEITVIGTVGPNTDGWDYDEGWKIANELNLPMVDEHGYKSPQWLWENIERYDAYDRSKSKVYLGEWAAFDAGRRSTLRAAIAEAAYLTGLERNADIVHFASYAPMLAKRDNTHWSPDLIYFSNTEVFPTISYHVQQLFSVNNGDTYCSTTVTPPTDANGRRTLVLGTWNTQAEFDDIRLTRGSKTLLTESFSSGTSDWKAASGEWQRRGGRYTQGSSHQPAVSRLEVPLDGSVYTLTLKARKTGGAEGLLVGVGTTPDNYYWWNLGGWGNSRHGVERSVSGARSLVGGNVPGHIESNRWYDIKIESDGQRVRFYLDGELIHDIPGTLESTPKTFVASCVKDSVSGDIIVKLVNGANTYTPVRVKLAGVKGLPATAEATVLAGANPEMANDYDNPDSVLPHTVSLPIATAFNYEAPPNSLTVIRIAPGKGPDVSVRAENDPLQWMNPIVLNRADPHVYLHTDGYYYMTASHPQYDRVELRRARTLGGLSTAEPKVIWRKNESGPMSKHFWAPEIHFLDGKWYAYFTAARMESQWDLRLYVLENDSANPLEGEWTLKPRIVLPTDVPSLDATVFENRGVRYLVWSQRPPGAPGSETFIAKMDTPWSVIGDQICLSRATLPWELRQHHVQEGQAVLIRNGRVFMTYSTNSTDYKYCMGLLTADADADLLDPKSWTKSPEPVLETDQDAGQWGPGHNCFTTTPDGKTDILVYHARNYKYDGNDPLNTGDRATRAQIVRWRSDGTPDFGTPVPNGLYAAR